MFPRIRLVLSSALGSSINLILLLPISFTGSPRVCAGRAARPGIPGSLNSSTERSLILLRPGRAGLAHLLHTFVSSPSTACLMSLTKELVVNSQIVSTVLLLEYCDSVFSRLESVRKADTARFFPGEFDLTIEHYLSFPAKSTHVQIQRVLLVIQPILPRMPFFTRFPTFVTSCISGVKPLTIFKMHSVHQKIFIEKGQ
jgi:hypothetical protein